MTYDYAAEAFKAVLYGRGDRNQQQSVASALILANGSKGELLETLEFYANGIGHTEIEDGGAVARAAIAKARGERS